MRLFLISLLFLINFDPTFGFYGGIPVPGRRVPAIRFFELFLNSCKSSIAKHSNQLEQLYKILENNGAEQIAEKMQKNLYFAVDDLDVEKLMGRWFTVVDSPNIHSDRCSVNYYKLVEKNTYISAFSTIQYSLSGERVKISHGSGNKLGPDPGSLLISHNSDDPCPYFPVKVGPVNSKNEYEYLVLTQALKYPTIVLARSPEAFSKQYQSEVREYLDKYGYMNPIASMNSPLYFLNNTICKSSNMYYKDIGEEDEGESENEI